MVLKITVFALGLSTSIFALNAYAQNAPITDIRLSSGGLAEIRRQADVTDNGQVMLTVPLAQVDDVLKSLTIRDPNGSGSAASLIGKEPLAEAFRDLPFSASDLSSQPDLIAALQGANITISGGGVSAKGRITGVQRLTSQDDKGNTIEKYRVSVFGGGKLMSFDLDKVEIAFDDAKLRDKLDGALAAVQASRTGDARDVAVTLKGSGNRKAVIEYVVPAPVWKATYRLALPKDGDKADLQGWAVIENTSADDWKDVRLSLSSGAPVTLHQRLYEAYFARRPVVPVYGPNGIVPLADKGGETMVNQSYGSASQSAALHQIRPPQAPAPARKMKEEAAPYTANFGSGWSATLALEDGNEKRQPLAVTSEADTSTLFTLSTPVSLARGQSLTLPFLVTKLSATRVSVYQPQLGIPNPVAAVMVKNDGASSLPPGILTLTEDDSGYAGDAQLAGLPAGETRMVMFATDRKVTVSSDSKGTERVEKIVYDNGVLKAETARQATVTYKIKGAQDADRTVVIEYPRTQGVKYSGDAIDSETPTAIRLKVKVPKGTAVETKLTEQRISSTSYTLSSLEDQEQIFAIWFSQAETDPKLAAKIKDASAALAKLNDAKQALGVYDDEVARIDADQQRIRENLQAIPAGSDLAKSYLANMTAQEKRLTEIAALRTQGEDTVKAARAAFSEKLKAF